MQIRKCDQRERIILATSETQKQQQTYYLRLTRFTVHVAKKTFSALWHICFQQNSCW